ncbi:DUF6215 domain-containing protein [Streptomyces sp. NPDC127084]|uniref:DUF6215 domain-containing protein n=1 Tax=Streptomyces sp. NPDC127084 TaxID=3347133 RepID=UPI00365F4D0D
MAGDIGAPAQGTQSGTQGSNGQGDAKGAKGTSEWGQAIAALVVAGALAAGLVLFQQASSSDSKSAYSPGSCPEAKAGKSSPRLTGDQLCLTLNRPDLAALLGTPGETPKKANGSDSSVGEIATPEGEVEFDTYTVNLSATYDGDPVAGSGSFLMSNAQHRKFLGRPAVLHSTQVIQLRFNLGGGKSEGGGPNLPARVLSVAQDAKDSGGSIDITVWRKDGSVPDDEVLLRVAEVVLPTVPGWDDTDPFH